MTTAITTADEIINDCEKYRQQIVSYCLHYDVTIEEAEDCVSRAYETLIEKLYKNEKILNPRAWLYKVSLNEIRALEKQKAKEKIFEFESNEEKEKALEKLSVSIDFIDGLVSEQSIHKCALKIISCLTDEEKELYILYYRKKLRLKEIADELGISQLNARKRKQRLKEKLQRLIDEYSDEIYSAEKKRNGGMGNE